MTQRNGWKNGKPILGGLPLVSGAYQTNPVAEAIVAPMDDMLMRIVALAYEYFPKQLDPDTADTEWLDWLAQNWGLNGEYWDTNWPVEIKRQLIRDSQIVIFPHKGSLFLLQYFLDTFGLSAARIEVQGAALAGVALAGDLVGGDPLLYSIVIDPDEGLYLRDGREWRLIERFIRTYMPCWCAPGNTANGNYLHYEYAMAGLAVAGDPV